MPKLEIDEIDRKILAAVQTDGRITTQALAERVGLSASPCARRLRLLEEAGIIKGYAAIIDATKVGLPISAFASVKLELQREEHLERFAQAIADWPEVADCYLMTGRHDYLLRVVVPDLAAYERFLMHKLTRLKGVASIETSFALGQMKRSDALPPRAWRGVGLVRRAAGLVQESHACQPMALMRFRYAS